MWKRTTLVSNNLSLRVSLLAVLSMAILLLVALFVMFFASRRSMEDDALQKAQQALDAANVNIDNILLSVEETAGNIYFMMAPHLNNPDSLAIYCRKMVESNRYVTGCSVALIPGFYEEDKEFFVYFHRVDSAGVTQIVRTDTFGDRPYYEQVWFTKPMSTFSAQWLNPLVGMETDVEPMTSFCMPITGGDGKPQGVICADVSISLLSTIISETKPTQNSYCALLDRDGSFIVHPMGKNMMDASVIRKANASVQKVADAMLGGETGYLPFEIHGNSYFVFFKPFERAYMPNRSMERLSWSVGVAILKEDIFGDFYQLFNYVLIIAVGGLLFMFVCTWLVIYLKLRPLKMLTEKVVRIADGHYYEAIPDTKSKDEIGSLQRNFQRMQLSLALHSSELQQLTNTIQKHSEELRKTYKQAKKGEKMRTVFMHNMTNQMLEPATTIDGDVVALRQVGGKKRTLVVKLAERIRKHGEIITKLLNNLLNQSEEEMRKEVEHD